MQEIFTVEITETADGSWSVELDGRPVLEAPTCYEARQAAVFEIECQLSSLCDRGSCPTHVAPGTRQMRYFLDQPAVPAQD